MELLPEWAPNIHPMVVHFPIAILGIAIFFDFVSFFLPEKKKWWTEEATAFLYGVGAAAAILVYYTGTLAADSVMLPAEAQSILTDHSDWAWWTVWFYGIYAFVRIVATWMARDEHRLKFHTGFFVLSLAGLFFLIQTGDHGARMVFQYGVGVQAAEVENSVKHDHEADHNGSEVTQPDSAGAVAVSTSFSMKENGNWTWNIEENAVTALQENFQWFSGSAESLNAEAVETDDGGYALSFSGDNISTFFTGEQSYETEQIDYYVNMASFDGTVAFVSHVQNDNNYDFVSIAGDGTVKQGRMIDGEVTIFEEGNADISQPLFVRVVGNGEHFRGYINKKMVVHGHGDSPKAGSVGMRFKGNGTILIDRIELTKLN